MTSPGFRAVSAVSLVIAALSCASLLFSHGIPGVSQITVNAGMLLGTAWLVVFVYAAQTFGRRALWLLFGAPAAWYYFVIAWIFIGCQIRPGCDF